MNDLGPVPPPGPERAEYFRKLFYGDTSSKGHPIYKRLLKERVDLHIEKSGGYGTNDDPFANFTAVADLTGQPRYFYPCQRAIEKLTRVMSLHVQGRVAELPEEFADIASLMDCAHAMLIEDEQDGFA